MVGSLEISESNRMFDIKYAPYADTYLGKAHGDGLQHMKRWLKKRFIFCDTLFDYAPSYENDVLTIRANTLNQMNLTIETYTPLYQHVSFYNGNMEKIKVKPGEPITFKGYAQTATDQEILIYGGSNIKSITGLASTNPNSMLIGGATRLTELDISNCPILTIVNSNKANFAPHVYLNKLNISNCPQLGGNLNISNSPLLQEVNAKGSGITGVLMPTSARNIEILRLPNTLKTLTLNDVPLLHTLEFDEGLAMESISISNCNALENYINFDLTQIQNVHLDNAYDNEELYMSATTNLTLMNMPTLQRVIYTPNNEYEAFDIANVINGKSYKITTFNNPNMTDFIVTAPHRLSYKNGEYGDIYPNTVFTANTLDISDTQFTNVKLLSTTDVYNLKVPTSMKNFYCDSAFDIDTDVIEDASYEIIHNDLIEPYTTNYGNNVLVDGETPNIIPSSANGSLIFHMYSNNTIQPTSTSPYIWDLTGLKLNDFYTYGMNNWIKQDDNGNITMPQRMSDYSVRIVNADITPNQYATHLYPLFINTTLPITGKLDYTKYNGTSLAWAYAYTTGDVNINPLDGGSQGKITQNYNKLYSTDFVDFVDVWVYKNTDTSKLSTNEAITEVYIELTNGNYKTRIDEVLQWYPNCTDLYFFEDGSVTTLANMLNNNNTTYKNQVVNVIFMDGYFDNLTSIQNTFREMRGLVSVSNIPHSVTNMKATFLGANNFVSLDRFPNNLNTLESCFTMANIVTIPQIPSNKIYMVSAFNDCPKLNCEIDLSNVTIDGVLNSVFYNCKSLTIPPILPTNYTGSMQGCFQGCTSLTEAPIIPEGVTNMANCFQGCTSLTTAPTIPSGVTSLENTFYGCSALTTAPNIPNGVTNMGATFYACTSLTTVPNIGSSVTSMASTFYDCKSLTQAPAIPNSVTNMNATFQNCSALQNAYFRLSATSYTSCFTNCSKLSDITWLGERTTDFSLTTLGSPSYTQTDVEELIEHLGEVESAKLTLGSAGSFLGIQEIMSFGKKGWEVDVSGGDFAIVFASKDVSELSTDAIVTTVIIELTNSNYTTRVDEVLAYYPNGVNIHFFDDGSVTTLEKLFNDNNTTYRNNI